MEELLAIIKETGIPFAYDHFAEGESPDPPFICYLLPGSDNFAADGVAYYVINNNMGYDGELELAMIPESFRLECLKEELDSNGVLIENSDVELGSFALLFEFDGDQKHIRHVLYNCAASRPGIEGQTNEDSKEVQTETLTITATPLGDGMVKAKTGNTTNAKVYADWYKAVYVPTPESGDPEAQSATTAAKVSTNVKTAATKEV